MKKDSQTIHREKAEKKATRDRKREENGYKSHNQNIGPSKRQESSLKNPFAQALAFAIRINNMKATAKPQKAYERRRR